MVCVIISVQTVSPIVIKWNAINLYVLGEVSFEVFDEKWAAVVRCVNYATNYRLKIHSQQSKYTKQNWPQNVLIGLVMCQYDMCS